MFDFAWTQIGLIGVVALVLIGPKDLPIAIKTVAGLVKKARRMAGEFQTHVDEMVKDTELSDIRNQISEIRNFDIRREVERAVDPDGGIRATFQQDPFNALTPPPAGAASLTTGGTAAESGQVSMTPAATPVGISGGVGGAPAFVPPQYVPSTDDAVATEADVSPSATPVPPAFVPPAFVPPAFVPPAFVPPAGTEFESPTQSRPAA